MSGNTDELAEGKQRSYLFNNNANPEPFLISNENNDCSRPNGNQIPNSKRRSKRQSSDMCQFDSLVRSGPKNKPKTSPGTSTSGQEGNIEQRLRSRNQKQFQLHNLCKTGTTATMTS